MATDVNLHEPEDTIKDLYFIFNIDEDEYGLEVIYVKEIVKYQPITKVPKLVDYIEGMTNLRGELIGVLDVRKRFQKPTKETDEHTCIVVIEYENYRLGLVVDAVQATERIPSGNIAPPPNAKLNHHNQFIRNIGRVTRFIFETKDMDDNLVAVVTKDADGKIIDSKILTKDKNFNLDKINTKNEGTDSEYKTETKTETGVKLLLDLEKFLMQDTTTIM